MKILFGLFILFVLVVGLCQDHLPRHFVEFVVFKLPFKVAKYFVIIVIINLIFGGCSLKGNDNYIMKQRTWNEIINLNR